MASILKAIRIANPGKRKRRVKLKNGKRKLSPLQKLFFGSKRQRTAIKNSKRKKRVANRTRVVKRKRRTTNLTSISNPRKKRRVSRKNRRKNVGSILSVGLNPGTVRTTIKRRKRKSTMARKKLKMTASARASRAAYRRSKASGTRKRRRRSNPGVRRHRRRRNPSVKTVTRYRNRAHRRHHRRRNPGRMGGMLSGSVGQVVGVIGGATLTKLITGQISSYVSSVNSSPILSILTTGVVAVAQGHLVGKIAKNPSLGRNMTIGGFVYMALQLINQFVPSIGGSLGLSGGRGMGLITGSSFYTPQVNLPGSMGNFVVPAAIPTYAPVATGMHGVYPNNAGTRMNMRRMGRMS